MSDHDHDHAAPWAQHLIVKIGGEVVASGELARLAADLAALQRLGTRVAIVHGGGPQVTALASALGLPTRQVAGRRVTDAATLDVLVMALGQVNVAACAALLAAGLAPVGLHGASSLVVQATRQPPRVYPGEGDAPIDLGLVGDVVGFNLPLIYALWALGHVPVIACLGADPSGALYNINADQVANQLAAALRSPRLLLVTSTPGVLRDVADPASRIARLTVAEARAAIADGTVRGGMIAKLEEAIAVVSSGVGAIHILGKLAPGDLVRACTEPGSVGTTLVP